jgi:ABC-type dipeptide/oligopeptide/nickel transport system permease component
MFLLLAMKQKTTLLVLGLTLTIAVALAIAPILSEIAYASADPTNNVCGNSGAAENNPHCN